jgi:hypothetical protein
MRRRYFPISCQFTSTRRPPASRQRLSGAPAGRPGGTEIALGLRHIVKDIRACWPPVEISMRGDGHYARPEAITWCEHYRAGEETCSPDRRGRRAARSGARVSYFANIAGLMGAEGHRA